MRKQCLLHTLPLDVLELMTRWHLGMLMISPTYCCYSQFWGLSIFYPDDHNLKSSIIQQFPLFFQCLYIALYNPLLGGVKGGGPKPKTLTKPYTLNPKPYIIPNIL